MRTTSRVCSVNGLELHAVEAGDVEGPLVILLHGFPDFWWGWSYQIEALAARGFHVVALDGRGTNLSGKPIEVGAYDLDLLASDVVGVAKAFERSSFYLVGHDWGGVIGWQVAARYPKQVEALAVLNAPHPDVFVRYVRRHPSQTLRSSYAAFFQLPWLPEAVLTFRRFAFLRRALTQSSRPGTFTADDLERYVKAWEQPGALSAMLNYYRAFARRPWTRPSRIKPRTLVIWGMQDAFLEPGGARASLKLCDRPHSLFFETAGHWVQREESKSVNDALLRFFGSVR